MNSKSTTKRDGPTPIDVVRDYFKDRPRARTWVLAALVYVIASIVYFAVAPAKLLSEHTPYNHFAHLANAWLDGHLDLENGPPGYARNNDFAKYGDKWFVTFPPFPAVLIMPLVAFAGEVELVRDGQFYLWLSGLGPALLFAALERLKTEGISLRSSTQNFVLTLCFAFGTVYFFTVEQGTVWYAAHVVGVILGAAYLLFAVGARFPLAAGIAVGLGFMTRAPLIFAVPLFALEALRVCYTERGDVSSGRLARVRAVVAGLDLRQLLRYYIVFSIPIMVCLAITFWHNAARFDSPWDTGYQHLTVAWAARMKKWGLFHYHYLSRNLAVVTSMLPYWGTGTVPFKINVHGLALWFTTPLYLWLLWPKRTSWTHWALWATVVAVGLPALFYQNSGWAQFGYRFSNDYAIFLFALFAIGARPMKTLFALAAVWSIVVNGFGAYTFSRPQHKSFYYWDMSQTKFFQKD
jgi:hypothetical protein